MMNKEIAKIFKKIKSVSNFDDYVDFIGTEFKPLLDYITDLQEKIERLKKSEKEALDTLESATYEYIKSINEVDRLNDIINETRRILGEYRHFSTPTEEQNSENEEIVDKAYIKLHSNLPKPKGDSSNE